MTKVEQNQILVDVLLNRSFTCLDGITLSICSPPCHCAAPISHPGKSSGAARDSSPVPALSTWVSLPASLHVEQKSSSGELVLPGETLNHGKWEFVDRYFLVGNSELFSTVSQRISSRFAPTLLTVSDFY